MIMLINPWHNGKKGTMVGKKTWNIQFISESMWFRFWLSEFSPPPSPFPFLYGSILGTALTLEGKGGRVRQRQYDYHKMGPALFTSSATFRGIKMLIQRHGVSSCLFRKTPKYLFFLHFSRAFKCDVRLRGGSSLTF